MVKHNPSAEILSFCVQTWQSSVAGYILTMLEHFKVAVVREEVIKVLPVTDSLVICVLQKAA